MGWPPAVVIVVRHGARLDAVDNQWHLTSPTPYDPPLTYGGWNQSKALGARIAGILRDRETDDDASTTKASGDLKAGNGNGRKKKHRVIIHTSPFLRCVQTSVAISAGLAQTPGIHIAPPQPRIQKTSHVATSPKSNPASLGTATTLAVPTGPAPHTQNKKPANQPENIKTSTIRVDAFLGEWLSPDYFEHITPPPSSILMVAGAKVDLLRAEDYGNLTRAQDVVATQPRGFPGGWGSPVVLPTAVEADESPIVLPTAVETEGSLASLPALAQALPDRERTSSLSGVAGNGNFKRGRSPSREPSQRPGYHGLYEPPVPNYAISSSSHIPAGYVAHARDACVSVDYQWDSMRGTPNCGDGGEYGEEWSSMHKRFRKGFQQLVTWYEENDHPGKLVDKTPPNLDGAVSSKEVDDDAELILILVSHGAGCNALIGALTNQPVLLDVAMASLTMAVRKSTSFNTPISTPEESPRSQSPTDSTDISVCDQYDVKIIANTEHLRTSSSSTPSSSRHPSSAGLPVFREPFGSSAGTLGGTDLSLAARSAIATGSLGTMRRTASIATSGPRKYVHGSVGLWTPPGAQEEVLEEHEDEVVVRPGQIPTVDTFVRQAKKAVATDHEKDEKDVVAPLGLWGAPRPPGDAEKMREVGTKRRWTVTER